MGFGQLNHFSPKEVAQRLGVSESSVKRWLDQGVVPVLRTAGGHRRVSEGSLEELLQRLRTTAGYPRLSSQMGEVEPSGGRRMTDRPNGGSAARGVPDLQSQRSPVDSPRSCDLTAPSVGPPALQDLQEAFAEALMQGQSQDCLRMVDRLIDTGFPMASAVDLLVTPAMHSLGRRWESGDLAIYQERRACGIVKDLIRRLKERLSVVPNGPVAIGGTPAGDLYELPTALVELAFCERGWQALSLGCNLPVNEFLAAVAEYRPRVLWFSLSYVRDEESLVADFNQLAAAIPKQTAILIGGRAATDLLRPRLRYTSHCDSLRNLAGLADTLMATA